MDQIISAREYKLATVVFGDLVKAAKRKAEPVKWLVNQFKGTQGGYSPEQIYPGCFGYQVIDGTVKCLGQDADGRLNFEKPVYQISLERLAHVALAGMYQISFMEIGSGYAN
jgi:hypothetical protein